VAAFSAALIPGAPVPADAPLGAGPADAAPAAGSADEPDGAVAASPAVALVGGGADCGGALAASGSSPAVFTLPSALRLTT
jgi:hypothetical protein